MTENFPTKPPPPSGANVPLAHKTSELYKKIYLLSQKIPKKDRFGIFLKIENYCLETIDLIICACFETRNDKLPYLKKARIKVETLKRLVRIASELKIIERKNYLILEADLQEISKMLNGWLKYLA